jgi:hypothetical protein
MLDDSVENFVKPSDSAMLAFDAAEFHIFQYRRSWRRCRVASRRLTTGAIANNNAEFLWPGFCLRSRRAAWRGARQRGNQQRSTILL